MDEKKDVPFYAFEAVVTRSEFAIKRLIAALIVAIILLFACNAGWLIAWMQFDYADAKEDMIAQLRGMPFGAKSLEKRQNELVNRLFAENERTGVNATRLVVRALQLHILDLDNLKADEE